MVEQAFRPELHETEARFINARTFAVTATLDGLHRPWASLFGPAGELFELSDATLVRIHPDIADGDPIRENLAEGGELGVLFFDHGRRRRQKSMGNATVNGDGPWNYRLHRNFGLCNKYIFKRDHSFETPPPQGQRAATETLTALSAADQAQLQASDTAFLASHHDAHGADPTHRGGPAGFVTVVEERTIMLPGYMGSGMLQTAKPAHSRAATRSKVMIRAVDGQDCRVVLSVWPPGFRPLDPKCRSCRSQS